MKGTIVDLVPAGQGGRRADGCLLFAAIEDTDGNTVNFLSTPIPMWWILLRCQWE